VIGLKQFSIIGIMNRIKTRIVTVKENPEVNSFMKHSGLNSISTVYCIRRNNGNNLIKPFTSSFLVVSRGDNDDA